MNDFHLQLDVLGRRYTLGIMFGSTLALLGHLLVIK